MSFSRYLAIALLAVGLSACGEVPAPTDKNTVNVEGLALIKTVPATASNFRQWDGVVEAVNQATLSAQTSGRVSALMVDVNDVVKVGDVLARFSNVEQMSGQNRAQAGLSAAQAQATELSESSQQLDYTLIRAPFNGVIGKRHVQVGETVAPGQAIFNMNSPEQLRVRISLPQTEAKLLEKDKAAKVLLDNGQEISVENIVVFPDADPETHTVTVRLTLPENTSELKPGITVKALLPASGNHGLMIPANSLVMRSEVTSVYVIGENTIGLRQIRLGQRMGDQVQVLSGLNPGETIAADPLAASLRLSEKQNGK